MCEGNQFCYAVMAMYWPENTKSSQKMYSDTIVLKSVIVSCSANLEARRRWYYGLGLYE